MAQRLSHAIEGLYHRGFLLIRTHTKTELQSLLTNTDRKVIDSESEQCTVAGCRWPRQGNHDVAAREPPASQEYPLDLLDPAPQTKAEDIYTAPTRREDTEDDRSIGSIEKHSRPRVDGSNLKIGTPRGDGEYIVVKSSELDYLSTTMKLTMPSPDRQRMVLVSWKLTRTTPPTPITPCLLRSCCCSQTTPTSWNSYSSPNSITVHPRSVAVRSAFNEKETNRYLVAPLFSRRSRSIPSSSSGLSCTTKQSRESTKRRTTAPQLRFNHPSTSNPKLRNCHEKQTRTERTLGIPLRMLFRLRSLWRAT